MKKFAICSSIIGALTMGALASTAHAASPFEDIDPSHWAYPKIKFLYDHGIIRGTGTGKFDGNERISRYEAAALVYQSLQYANRTRAQGGQIDADIMDTINSLMTELTDEMQVIEVRIEENSDAIAMLRNHLASMHGKPTQGVTVPMGQGRLKFMGQTMISLVSGGANSAYANAFASNSTTALVAPANPGSGATEFVNDYIMLAMAADIDERTSFFAKANVYTGGSAGAGVVGASTPDPVPGAHDLAFNDYVYVHVKDLWSDWDMTLGRMALPWGHETGGAFRTNPYFVSNSMVDNLYGNRLVTGAYFSTDSDDGEWNWGIGIHNGDQGNPNGFYSHLNTASTMMYGGALPGALGFTNFPVGPLTNVGANAMNNNEDDSFGFLLHVGSRSADGDFRWDLNYFTNGGDLGSTAAPAPGVYVGLGSMSYFNLGADYRVNEDWAVTAEFVSGSVDVPLGPRASAPAFPAGNVGSDDFTTWYLQIVYNLDRKSTVGLRMGEHSYSTQTRGLPTGVGLTGTLDDEVNEMAFAYSRKVSDNGTLLVEYSTVDWDTAGGATKAGNCGTAATGSCLDDFDTVRASYRVDF